MKNNNNDNLESILQDEGSILRYIFEYRYEQKLTHCPKCEYPFQYVKSREHRAYQCRICLNRIFPLAGTALHSTRQPLSNWTALIRLLSESRNSVPSMNTKRLLRVSRKTALRMTHKILEKLDTDDGVMLEGPVIEADETFPHGAAKQSSYVRLRRRRRNKPVVFAMVERRAGGRMIAKHIRSKSKNEIFPLIKRYVPKHIPIHTDQAVHYKSLTEEGYIHKSILHNKKQFVDKSEDLAITTNNIESAFRRVKHVYKNHTQVTKLQLYLNLCVFYHNHRLSDSMFREMFHKVIE